MGAHTGLDHFPSLVARQLLHVVVGQFRDHLEETSVLGVLALRGDLVVEDGRCEAYGGLKVPDGDGIGGSGGSDVTDRLFALGGGLLGVLRRDGVAVQIIRGYPKYMDS